MTWKTDLKTFTKTRSQRLGENGVYPDDVVLNRFVDLVEDRKFSQILFEFGKQYLEVALTFSEREEAYLVCGEIMKQLEEYNNVQGDDIKLRRW